MQLLKKTKCHVHTFDCTGQPTRFNKKPNHDHLHFHHMCIGSTPAKGHLATNPSQCTKTHDLCGDTYTLEQIQNMFNHTTIDLLKLDIEGWEWPIFDIESTHANMPMQLLMEVHFDERQGVRGVIHDQPMKSFADIDRFQRRLVGLGYAIVKRDDNPACMHCTELTLMRISC